MKGPAVLLLCVASTGHAGALGPAGFKCSATKQLGCYAPPPSNRALPNKAIIRDEQVSKGAWPQRDGGGGATSRLGW